MNSRGTLCFGWFLLLTLVAGCGGGKGVDPNKVTVRIAPAAVTVAASDQVMLQAVVKGTATDATAAVTWSIDEQKTDGASGAQCFWLETPPEGPCPDGTIEQTTAGNFLTVTYHAPSTSGTFHVTAEWSTFFDPVITKDGTSVVTVSP
jgi:hypothetical protein